MSAQNAHRSDGRALRNCRRCAQSILGLKWSARGTSAKRDCQSETKPEMEMVEIQIAYQGELRCSATHVESGTTINTDAPKDNMGKGESFSPTDLVATALGTCMLTLMGIAARSLNVDLTGTHITVQKEMVATPMRRIGKLG